MTLIACDCSIDNFEDRPSFSREQWRVARKPHVCCECREVIEPGSKYEYVAGCWSGEWDEFKTCETCVRIREWYCASGWNYGGLAEQIYECLEFDYRTVPEDDE
jgi:hypothetical protein